MLDPRWRSIREALLTGGIAPRHVARLCAEWRAHHDDLVQAALHRGNELATADRSAWATLGGPAELIAAALARPELRSMVRRHPALAFGLAPPLVFAVAFVGILTLMLLAAKFAGISQAKGIRDVELALRTVDLSAVLHVAFGWLLPICAAVATVSWAVRHRAFTSWPAVGVALIAGAGASTNVDLLRDAAMVPVALQAGVGIRIDTLGSFLLRAAATLGCAGLASVWLRSRLARIA
jgi:hypothetical protein